MMTFLIGVFFALSNIPWADLTQAGPQPIAQEVISQAVLEGQRLSGQADGLVKAGHELEAARLYLAAHENYQKTILAYFEQGLCAGLGGGTADEDALMRAGGEVAELRNVNLSKL
jgi:hypothetical protein